MKQWIAGYSKRLDPAKIGTAAVLLLAVALYSYRLGAKSIWLDESFTYVDARDIASITEVPQSSLGLPATWFLLVRWSLAIFGDNDAALRLLAAVFAVLAVVAFARCAHSLFDRETSLFATFLLAASPLMVHHAQEARPYSAQVFLNVISTVALWNLLYVKRGSKLGAAFVYALTIAAGFYISYMSVLVVPAHLILFLIWMYHRLDEETSRRTVLVVLALLASAIACLPLLGNFLLVLRPDVVTAPPTGPGLPSLGADVAFRFYRNAFFARDAFWWANLYGSGIAALVSTGLASVAVALDGRRRHQNVAIVWCLTLMVVPVMLLLFSGGRTTWSRYYIVALPWFVLLVARGLTSTGELVFRAVADAGAELTAKTRRAVAVGALAILVGVHVPAWASYYREEPGYYRDKAGWKAAARYLEETWRPGELIIAADLHAYLCLARYLPAILPHSFEDMVALLDANGGGFVVDGGWRAGSDQITIRQDLGARQETRIAFTAPHVRLYSWEARQPSVNDSIEIDLGRRTGDMFLKDGWYPSRYRRPEGPLVGIIDDGPAAISFILSPSKAARAFDITIELFPFLDGRSNLTLTLNGSAFFRQDLEGVATTIEASIPQNLLRAGSNVLQIRHEAADPPVTSPPVRGMPAAKWSVNLAAHSVGGARGSFAWTFVAGKRYSWEQERRGVERGYTVMVLDERGRIESWESFDTCCAPEGRAPAARMAAFIHNIPNGRFVIATTRQAAGTNLTAEAVAALREIGAEGDLREHPAWMHAVVGIKGSPPGTAAEAFGPGEARVVVGEDPEADMVFVGRLRIAESGAPDDRSP